MARPLKMPPEELDQIRGLAARAVDRVDPVAGRVGQRALEDAMERLVVGTGGTGELVFRRWAKVYRRSSRYSQLAEWRFLDVGVPELAAAEPATGVAAIGEAPSYLPRSSGEPQVSRGPIRAEDSVAPGAVGLEASNRDAGRSPAASSGRTSPRFTRALWADLSEPERMALVGRILRDDSIFPWKVLHRLRVVDVERFFNEVDRGTYTGDGCTPQEEIALLVDGRRAGAIPLPDWGEGDHVAKRVYLHIDWPPYFIFEDGSRVKGILTRRRLARRWLSWFIPWLA